MKAGIEYVSNNLFLNGIFSSSNNDTAGCIARSKNPNIDTILLIVRLLRFLHKKNSNNCMNTKDKTKR
jgi:hypothetical protein